MISSIIRKPQFACIIGAMLLVAAIPPNETIPDQVIADDLIVQGSIGVGIDSINNQDFGFDTIRLSENNLQIHFDDTSITGGFPTNDWRILINDSTNGGMSYFRIEDSTNAKTPFTVFANSSNNSLNVAPTGIGIGTGAPTAPLHILANGSSSALTNAMIRGEVTNAFPAGDRTMLDLRNHGAVVMNLMDTSAVGAMPYQIRASNDRLSFQQFSGNKAGMIIFADGAIRYVANSKPNLTVTPTGNLNVIGQSGGGNLNVLGHGVGTGNLFVAGNISYNGTLNGPSDRNIKENFSEIDPQEILAKVVALPITKWNYIADEKDTPHLGPMAQDFYSAFGLGDDDKRIPLLDNSGVALAAIQGLNKVVQAKENEIADLRKTVENQAEAIATSSELISRLNERLERLEAMVNPESKQD